MALLEDRYPAFKFENVGDTFEGRILSVTELEDREPNGKVKEWSPGNPKKCWVLAVEPEAGETRAVWVRGNMVKAVREAAMTGQVRQLEGSTIKVRFNGLGDPKPGMNPAKLFQVRLTPGVVQTSSILADDEEPF